MRYFVFLKVEDKILANLLNIAIFTLNPIEKWDAHITVAGPFNSERNLPKNREYKRKVSVFGPGFFSNPRQSTVFLKVGTFDMRDVWLKPDYPFNPHLTLYDGHDRELAEELLHRLHSSSMFMKFYVSRLEVVQSLKGQLDLFPIKKELDLNATFLTHGMNFDDLLELPKPDRIEIAMEALHKATVYCQSL